VALGADPTDRKALEVRLKALEVLRARCHNVIERGWLDDAIARTHESLNAKSGASE
jgi:hypothetical protein